MWVLIQVGLVKSAGSLVYEYLKDVDHDDFNSQKTSCFADSHPAYGYFLLWSFSFLILQQLSPFVRLTFQEYWELSYSSLSLKGALYNPLIGTLVISIACVWRWLNDR